MLPKWPMFRWRLRSMLALVALCAAMLWGWSTFLDPTGRLIRRLGADQPAYVRREAAIALGYDISPSRVDQAVSALILALKDPSPRVRESAIAGLFGHGGLASRFVPEVIPLLKDEDSGVRVSAAAGLGSLVRPTGPERALAIPALVGALVDKRSDVREVAAESLIMMGESKAALGALAGMMRAPDPMARRASAPDHRPRCRAERPGPRPPAPRSLEGRGHGEPAGGGQPPDHLWAPGRSQAGPGRGRADRNRSVPRSGSAAPRQAWADSEG